MKNDQHEPGREYFHREDPLSFVPFDIEPDYRPAEIVCEVFLWVLLGGIAIGLLIAIMGV